VEAIILAGGKAERLGEAAQGRPKALVEIGGRPLAAYQVEQLATAGVQRVLCTAIERDGTLTGPDVALVAAVAAAGLRVTAAGGIRDPADVEAVAAAGAEAAVVGRALLQQGT